MSLVDRLSAALSQGDAPLDTPLFTGDEGRPEPGGSLTPAAVLIAITDRAEPGVILTQRTETLRRHAGEIAFPGGRIDPEDGGPVAAALREAEEEIALPPAAVQVVGTVSPYRTVTSFEITPVIGAVPPDLPLRPSEAEVASVFEVPLAFLLDPTNHQAASATWRGQLRRFHEIHWQGRRIWGATAAMLINLSRQLSW